MFGIETIFETLPQFLIVCAILALAEAVYVLLGFGAGLIAVGTMALLLPELKDAVVILLLVNLPAELWIVRSSWQRISWRGVPCSSRMPGNDRCQAGSLGRSASSPGFSPASSAPAARR
ncbi:MAG: hypothetical protein IFK92_02940 [Acidobacteria bacterium]|nr:hypothetical protein [Candidatus Sulfomarinibacter kjeldsenii]